MRFAAKLRRIAALAPAADNAVFFFHLSTVFFLFRYSQDDFPYTTELTLEEGAAGKTDVPAIIVMDGISDARVRPS